MKTVEGWKRTIQEKKISNKIILGILRDWTQREKEVKILIDFLTKKNRE